MDLFQRLVPKNTHPPHQGLYGTSVTGITLLQITGVACAVGAVALLLYIFGSVSKTDIAPRMQACMQDGQGRPSGPGLCAANTGFCQTQAVYGEACCHHAGATCKLHVDSM